MTNTNTTGFEILTPSLALDAPDLTPDKIKMALANHALALKTLAEESNDTNVIVTALVYTMRAFMEEYPLKAAEGLITKPPTEPPSTAGPKVGQYL